MMEDSVASVETIVEYVIHWVERRYNDDEVLSIALFTVNHCLLNGNPTGDMLPYIMRSVWNAIQSYKVHKYDPLPEDIIATNPNWSIPYEILNEVEQAVICYRYEMDMNIHEIARGLKLTYTQAKYKLCTAHNKLRFYYEKERTK